MEFTDEELAGYLDEALPVETMALVEKEARAGGPLAARLAVMIRERDAGEHSLGDIWRRGRLSCPSREQLGSYMLQALADDEAAFIRFHLETFECRYCRANLDDLTEQARVKAAPPIERRRRFFQSSKGHLP